ncbi:MAG: alcohol dehydrogenase catalytic domain-containing protein [Nocardioidaceae bacterium]|nr:alcohol dehydrogenase catalytic domain-containing protein [Nocardioidaceae bacterium]
MRAVVFDVFGQAPHVGEVDEPPCPPHAAVVAVRATGVCRSDWHAWHGHDDTVSLPHVPGHEFVGSVVAVGADVRGWSGGERVTAPFVNACGTCSTCRDGRHSICPHQTQPGFDRLGSFAERVVVHHADVNLVAVPDGVDDATAAGLGCRFATAYRAVGARGRAAAGEHVVVLGCGGVGLAAVVVAVARGAQVVAVDVSAAALDLARTLGASVTVDASGGDVVERVRAATDGGAHLVVEALGRASLLRQGITLLRPGGRHVQVGLLAGDDATPAVDVGRVVALELELLGSHGMSAHEYPAMLAEIAAGTLDASSLVGRTVGLDDAPAALAAMDGPATGAGTTVVVL